jgi:hypothetical protein
MSETEFLTADELTGVTGYKRIVRQRNWLDRNGWSYVVNAAGRPVVGRWFARLRLAGVQPSVVETECPNFAALD